MCALTARIRHSVKFSVPGGGVVPAIESASASFLSHSRYVPELEMAELTDERHCLLQVGELA